MLLEVFFVLKRNVRKKISVVQKKMFKVGEHVLGLEMTFVTKIKQECPKALRFQLK